MTLQTDIKTLIWLIENESKLTRIEFINRFNEIKKKYEKM